MKRFSKIFAMAIIVAVAFMLNSCGISKPKKSSIIPVAASSITEPISLDYLNLSKDSYQIIKTETAEAVVVYEEKGRGTAATIKINEQNDEYVLEFKKNATTGDWDIKYSGIVKYGYLSQYDRSIDIYEPSPEAFARGLAAYRLINSVQDQGADGIIEPIVTMKVGQEGKKIIFTATLSAKIVKIKAK